MPRRTQQARAHLAGCRRGWALPAAAALIGATLIGGMLIGVAGTTQAASPTPRPPVGGDDLAGRTVTGTVVRTSAEGSRDGETTWLATPEGHLPVPAAELASVPDGATVRAVLGARRVRGSQVVLSVQVTGAAGAAVAKPVEHTVTIALVTAPGTGRDRMTGAALKRTVQTQVADYWRRQSEGTVSLHVDKVLDWYATPYSCADIWALWDDVGRKAGFTAGLNRHLLVYLSSAGALPDCYSGLATVGANRSSGGTMYVRSGLASLVAHEFGHNLGLRHSQALQCDRTADGRFGAGAFPASCREVGYGDWYDVMGISWQRLGTLSAAQALHLGVLGAARQRTIGRTAVVDLKPVSAHRGLAALRVKAPDGAVYVLEYRPAAGQDGWLSAHPGGLGPGVLIRREQPDPAHAGETLLLDASFSPRAGWQTDHDAAARPGQPVTLAQGQLTVTVLSSNPGNAEVRVAVAGDGVASAGWPGNRLRQATRHAVH